MSQNHTRVAVVTSGGDVPGLNACVRAVARAAVCKDIDVIGIRRGYSGLIDGDFVQLGARSVSGIIDKGGTFLGTSRCEAFYTEAGRKAAAAQLERAGIGGMVVIGGNGTLAGAMHLNGLGVPLIGVPKTIDNDQYGTDIAIGVDTALNTIADAVGKIKDTASSHRRAFLIETMGRGCGYLAVASAIITGAEMALVPEFPVRKELVADVIRDAYRGGKAHCIIIVAEGWKPGMRDLQRYLQELDSDEDASNDAGFDVREVVLGHVQRGGAPSAFDRMLATRMGVYALERLADGTGNGMMVGLQGRQLGLITLGEATSRQRPLDPELLRLIKVTA